MFTKEQKKEIRWLEQLKGACCTSNNLQLKLSQMPVKEKPKDKYEIKFLEIDFKECLNRMEPLVVSIPEIASICWKLAGFMDKKLTTATYGEMCEIAYDVHIAIDNAYYAHYSDKMGIVKNPRK